MRKTLAAALVAALVAASSLAQAESAAYSIDPNHTWVTFEALHFNTSTLRGRFERKEGGVTMDRAARTGTADITIDASSVSTGVASLDEQLKGKDFFNAGVTPSVRFVGDRFTFKGDKVGTVAGTLTMLGRTLPVTLTATHFNCYENPLLRREVCGGDFETTIARSRWGMNYGINFGFPDNIRLLIQIEAIRN
jgi:polyisoprenoid-binding protein YceI